MRSGVMVTTLNSSIKAKAQRNNIVGDDVRRTHGDLYRTHGTVRDVILYPRPTSPVPVEAYIATGLEGDPTSLVEIGGTERFRFL